MTYDYRKDGWPLCPQCGEDELMSLAAIATMTKARPTDPMRCYVCHWSGEVPPRPLVLIVDDPYAPVDTGPDHRARMLAWYTTVLHRLGRTT